MISVTILGRRRPRKTRLGSSVLDPKERGNNMAHLESYTKKDVKKVIKEHGREADTYKNWVDPQRTHLNWTYQDMKADEVNLAINSRCMDITNGKKLQEQTNVMCEWCITYPFTECIKKECEIDGKTRHYHEPKEWEHCRMFFDEVYDFVRERYGSENVICAYVHMDETTPQMHIDFVPETISRKSGKKTVSSASLATRKELKMFHRDLQERMNAVFGKNDYILNGRTKGGYTTDEMKERTEQEARLERKSKMADKVFLTAQEALQEIDDVKASYEAATGVKKASESVEREYREFLQRHKLKDGRTLLQKFDEERQRKAQFEVQAEANRVERIRAVTNMLNRQDSTKEHDYEK